MAPKKLYKSATDRKISGVCAGIAEYFGVDPTLIRIAWLIFALMGWGIMLYIICAIIVPEDYTNISPTDSSVPKDDNYYNNNHN